MKTKKLLSVILALCMLLSVIPMIGITASAATNPDLTFDRSAFANITSSSGGTQNATVNGYAMYLTTDNRWFITGTPMCTSATIGFTSSANKIKKIQLTFSDTTKADGFCSQNSSWTHTEDTLTCYYEFASGKSASSITFNPKSYKISQFEIWLDLGTVELDTTSIMICTGDSFTLNATTTPASQAITWSSSDKNVATVEDGIVTALKAGTTTITAEFTADSSVNASCSVTVSDLAVGCSFDKGNYRYTVLTLEDGKGTVSLVSIDKAQISGNIILPDSVTVLNNVFSVTTIGYEAFYNCENLTGVVLPDGLTTIGEYAFKLTSITSLSIPTSVKEISRNAFYGMLKLKNVTIPDSVVTIGDYAFYNAPIEELTIPTSVRTIGFQAFAALANGVSIENVTFETDDINSVTIGLLAFGDITLPTTVETKKADVKIVGFNNNIEVNGNVRNGQLLKPVVENYSGSTDLYYQFSTNNSTANHNITYSSSNCSITESFMGGGYTSNCLLKNEAYAAITAGTVPTTLTCNVYEPVLTNGKLSFILIATVTYENPMGTDNDTQELADEFSENDVLVMQAGDAATSLTEILRKAGFTHLNCYNVHFGSVTLTSGESITIEGSDKNAVITPVKTGLSKISFTCYTEGCTYHGAAGSEDEPVKGSIYIYVVEKSTLTSTAKTITVTDNTTAPATSTYKIGLLNSGTTTEKTTTFTGIYNSTEYDVVQTLSIPIEAEGKTYTGVYHNYISTKDVYNVSCADCTNGSVSVGTTTAYGEGDTVTITATPDSGYSLVGYTVYKTDDISTAVTVSGNEFKMPAYDVTVEAAFVIPPEAGASATYSASLTLNKNIDINFKMSNLSTDFNDSLLTITVDGADWTNYTVTDGTLSGVLKAVEPKDIGTDLHIVITYDGVTVKDFNYSVKSYCEAVFNANIDGKYDKLADLCKALLNYGKYAEDYANGNTDSTVNEGHEATFGSNYEFTGLKEKKKTLGKYAGEGSEAYLVLGSTIKLNFLLKNCSKALENDDPETQNFFVLNDENEPKQIDPERVIITKNGSDYLVSIDLYASQLSTSYTLKLKGVDTKDFCITYGVYNYCSDAQSQTDEAFTSTVKTLCKAIHNYSQAVDAYIESTK